MLTISSSFSEPVVDPLLEQAGGDVVGRFAAGLAAYIQQLPDIDVELQRHGRRGRSVAAQGGGLVLENPLAQRLMQRLRPAHEGALDPQGKVLGELAHQLDLAPHRQTLCQIDGDLPAHRLEDLHSLAVRNRVR